MEDSKARCRNGLHDLPAPGFCVPCKRATRLRAQRKYEQTPSGRVTIARRNATTGLLADRRYRATIKGQIAEFRHTIKRRVRRNEQRIAILEVALNADP